MHDRPLVDREAGSMKPRWIVAASPLEQRVCEAEGVDRRPGNGARRVAGKEQRHFGDFLRLYFGLTQSSRHAAHPQN